TARRSFARMSLFMWTKCLHEPQRAAGILPTDQSEKALPARCRQHPGRCRLTCSRFMVPRHAKNEWRLSMKRVNRLLLSGLALVVFRAGLTAADDPGESPLRGYYRFPAIHRDTIVFTAEGDLWRVGVKGGVAQRLTSHPGEESRAAFSPDGKTLAFSAQYEGPLEVYTMPAEGGLPGRRTFEGGAALVAGWTPD